MEVINAAVRAVLSGLLPRMAPLSAVITLALFAVASAIVLLGLTRLLTAPARIADAKRQIAAGLYELRLFRHDPVVLWAAQRGLIAAQLRYLRDSLLPLIAAIPLMTIAIGHLEPYFGAGVVAPDRQTVVAVVLTAPTVSRPALALHSVPADPSTDVRISDAVWLPASQSLMWDVSAARPGRYELTLEHAPGGQPVQVPFVVGAGAFARHTAWTQYSLRDQWLTPGVPPLSATNGIHRIEVDYPDADIEVLGWHMGWLALFLVLLVLGVVILRRPMHVEL